MKCPACGHSNNQRNVFCGSCGAKLKAEERQESGGDEKTQKESGPPEETGAQLEGAYQTGKPWRIKWQILAPILLVALAAAAGVLFLTGQIELPGFPRSEYLYLGTVKQDGKIDLFLAKDDQTLNEAILLTENADTSYLAVAVENASFLNFDFDQTPIGLAEGAFGGFGKSRSDLYLLYGERDSGYFEKYNLSKKETTELFSSENNMMTVIPEKSESIFIIEIPDTIADVNTYIAEDGERFEKFGQMIPLTFSNEQGAGLVTLEIDTGTELDEISGSIYLYKNADLTNPVEVFDITDVNDFGLSGDGNIIWMVAENDVGMNELKVFDAASESLVLEVENEQTVTAFTSKSGGSFGYLAETSDGSVDLFYLNNGEREEIARSPWVTAEFNNPGTLLAYTVQNEDAEDLYIKSLPDAAPVKILSGDVRDYFFAADEPGLIIYENKDNQDHYHYYDVPTDTLIELFDGDFTSTAYSQDIEQQTASVQLFYGGGIKAHLIPDSKSILFVTIDQRKELYQLYIYNINDQEGYFLRDKWEDFNLLTTSHKGDAAVFYAREDSDDDYALYITSIEKGQRSVKIDDTGKQGYINAVFSRSDREIFFTANRGDREQNVEIRKATWSDDRWQTKTMYRSAFLIDVNWIDRYQSIPLQSFNEAALEGMTFCTGPQEMDLEKTAAGVVSETQHACYSIELTAQETYYFSIGSDEELVATLYDRDGNVMTDHAIQSGEPGFRFSPNDTKIYYLAINAVNEEQADFELRVNQGVGVPEFDDAVKIASGEKIRGYILSDDRVSRLSDFGISVQYADMYYFMGESGDEALINVRGSSYGSYLDTVIYLVDPDLQLIRRDDDSGSVYESFIREDLEKTGRYYVVVTKIGGGSGSDQDYFYDIELKIQ